MSKPHFLSNIPVLLVWDRIKNYPLLNTLLSLLIITDTDTVIYIGEESGWQRQTVCGRTISNNDTQTISCSPDKPVRYVTIWHQTSFKVLKLCEVNVNGYRYQGTHLLILLLS